MDSNPKLARWGVCKGEQGTHYSINIVTSSGKSYTVAVPRATGICYRSRASRLIASNSIADLTV